MSVDLCAREAEVVECITADGWPQCAEPELRAHVHACAVCADVVAVASAMRDEHTAACQQANLPTAGVVWWRAELKARQEAAQAAARPMAFVQVVAGACALAATLTALGLAGPWLRAAGVALVGVLWSGSVPLDQLTRATAQGLQGLAPVLLAAGACLVLVPVALYVAFARD